MLGTSFWMPGSCPRLLLAMHRLPGFRSADSAGLRKERPMVERIVVPTALMIDVQPMKCIAASFRSGFIATMRKVVEKAIGNQEAISYPDVASAEKPVPHRSRQLAQQLQARQAQS